MVFYLSLSIIFSAGLFIILKYFYFWKIDTLHGIIFNYWAAALFAFLMSPQQIIAHAYELSSLWYITGTIGCLFILVFYITGKTTQQLGVGVASVASKMSMVIPIAAGILLYRESLGMEKLAGIILAIPAVILVSRPAPSMEATRFRLTAFGLPAFLFLGAGLVDTAIKYTQHHFMNDGNRQLVIMSIFASAGTVGMLILGYEKFILRKKINLRSILGGILLGTTNYLSLYFLLKCLEDPRSESSTVFAFVNIGVVVISFFSGLLLFREKPGRDKIIGLILAIVAIAILSYSG